MRTCAQARLRGSLTGLQAIMTMIWEVAKIYLLHGMNVKLDKRLLTLLLGQRAFSCTGCSA